MPVFTMIFIRPHRQRIWITSTGFYPQKVLQKASWFIFTWAKRILKPVSSLKQQIFLKNLWRLKTVTPGTGTGQKSIWPPSFICRTSPPRPMPCGRRSKQARRNCPYPWQRLTAVSGCWRKNHWPHAKPRWICCGSRAICRRSKPLIIS